MKCNFEYEFEMLVWNVFLPFEFGVLFRHAILIDTFEMQFQMQVWNANLAGYFTIQIGNASFELQFWNEILKCDLQM